MRLINGALPINGVSDAFVEKTTLLNRDDEYLDNELSAALEVGYLLRLASSPSRNEERVIYVSRAGFFLETDTPGNSSDIVQRYYHLVTQPRFTQQSERENRARAVRWFISPPSLCGQKPLITASVPVYYHHVWYGVVAMDFTFATCVACWWKPWAITRKGNTSCMTAGLPCLRHLSHLLWTLIILTRAN